MVNKYYIMDIKQVYKCANNGTHTNINLNSDDCPFGKTNILLTEIKRTYIIPGYMAVNDYDINVDYNIIELCSVCHDNYINQLRKAYPCNRPTYNMKYQLLCKTFPELVLHDTVYRKSRFDYLNRQKYLKREIDNGCSIMDVDGDMLYTA